jgi:hypothetical protein
MKALLVYPTHKNCREQEQPYLQAGVRTACYPARVAQEGEETPQNCWNPEADRAETMGFAVTTAVCPLCPAHKSCAAAGYLKQLQAAREAVVTLCTHKRAAATGLAALAQERNYISIHENPIDLLRPRSEASEPDLQPMQQLLDRLLNEPSRLNWFGDATRVDDDGHEYHSEELAVRKDRLYQFTRHLARVVDELVAALRSADQTSEWRASASMKRAEGIERMLYAACRSAEISFRGQPWKFLLAAAAGELHAAAILVSTRFEKGGGPHNPRLLKSVIGVANNLPPESATTWFNDATSCADRLSAVLGKPVEDKTPQGRLELQKKAVQIPRDLTRRTSPSIAAGVIRGVLADRPQFRRVGIICHQPHVKALRDLGPEFRDRIVKVAHFGSGEDRSSNEWHTQCDLVLVAGTPRIPPVAIAAYLVQVGEVGAACRPAEWGTLFWEAPNESGETVRIKSSGYLDEAWRRAYRDLVRAQLVQAVGRGRGILEEGCEVLVLSNEECGLGLSDAGVDSVSGTAAAILQAIQELSAQNANKYILGKSALKSAEIAQRVGIGTRQAQIILGQLEQRGLVQKVGERGGWRPVLSEASVETSSP